jgi:hypothetical protein
VILECLTGIDNSQVSTVVVEEIVVVDILKAIFKAEKGGRDLEKTVQDMVRNYR